jgi:diguanylate cyclase (GGDEF)-like protein
MLDFMTLYVIIMLNSLSFAVIWAAIATSYKSLRAARYWLTSLMMTCASGPMLVAGEGTPFLKHIAICLVSGAFAVNWQGLRVFFGHTANRNAIYVVMLASLAAMMVFGSSGEAKDVVFALTQVVPVLLAIVTLLSAPQRYVGKHVTIVAAVIVIVGQTADALANALQMYGVVSAENYDAVAPWFLVCAIVSGGILNLGFLIMALDRSRDELNQLATRDDLTGLPNRRGFREKLTHSEKSLSGKDTTAVLMMIDLDKFKAINDTFGHAAGDAALVHIAAIAQSVLRGDDILCRIGGDEFCVFLPQTDTKTASAVADSLNKKLASTPFRWKEHEIVASASIGLSEWRPASESSLSDSIDNADAALLRTKRNGRNSHSIHETQLGQ